MPDTTTRFGIRHPESGDAVTLATYFGNLADDVDAALLGWSQGIASSRPAAGTAGRVYHATDTDVVSLDDGGEWLQLLRSGDTLTGFLDFARNQLRKAILRDFTETVNVVAASGSTRTLDLAVANVHQVTLNASCTFSFAGARSGEASTLALRLVNDSSGRAVTWPVSVKWPNGSAPTVNAANSVHWLTFISLDGGSSWDGFPGGLSFA